VCGQRTVAKAKVVIGVNVLRVLAELFANASFQGLNLVNGRVIVNVQADAVPLVAAAPHVEDGLERQLRVWDVNQLQR
jgi:hypothetical protein